MRSSESRERGGTFTFASLALAALLLLSATLLSDASRTSLRSAAFSARQSQLRDGAFAGGTWAQKKFEGKPLEMTLELTGCSVAVKATKTEKGLLRVESRAKNGINEEVAFVLTYSAKGELERFDPLR